MSSRRFKLGQIVATTTAKQILANAQVDPRSLIMRHLQCDWGDLCEEDAELNDDALIYGGRLFSVYQIEGEAVWIITEADRSATTLLMPEDY
ncbi:MAG: hypothetical protein ACEQSD_01055 [Flavobacteriales bacterium]